LAAETALGGQTAGVMCPVTCDWVKHTAGHCTLPMWHLVCYGHLDHGTMGDGRQVHCRQLVRAF